MESQSVAETIGQVCKIRPALKSFLKHFEPLLAQRQATAEQLAPLLAEAGISIAAAPGDEPVLQGNVPAGLAPFLRLAAVDLLPLLLAEQAVAAHANALQGLFGQSENDPDLETLVAAMFTEEVDILIALARKYGLPPDILGFASDFIVSAVLRALVANIGDDEFSGWRKGFCPVCGYPPVLAWLGKKPMVKGNEFLADGGGKKHLHCGMCGANWHFLRGVCPECGTQGQEAMQIYGEENRRHERIDWCEKCRAYLPLIDLRELADVPDMDAMALCLMHLDLVAAEKNLTPIKPSFWNSF